MSLTLNSIVVLVIFCLQGIYCGSVQRDAKNVVYFPNPNNDGSLIPAYLDPSPAPRIEFNESFIHFYLYTKQNPTQRQEIIINDAESLRRSNFISGAPTKLMSHGFGGSDRSGFPQGVKNEYLRLAEDMNVITIDWEALAQSPYYFEAATNTRTAGRHGANFLEFLVREGVVTRDKIHVIGFSLGGHVAGIVGSNMLALPARVTSLDPAKPLFDVAEPPNRIDPGDAEFVDVIHTSGLTLGLVEPTGHADFYPNGGASQPGCGTDITGSCAHGRAPDCFEESVMNPSGFRAQICDNWDNFQNGLCTGNDIAFMGNSLPTSTQGKFFVVTNSQKPLAQG